MNRQDSNQTGIKDDHPLIQDKKVTDPTEHALSIMGFQRIRDEIEGICITEEARERARKLTLLRDREDIERSLSFIQDLRMLHEKDGYPLDGLYDIRDELSLAAKDGTLEPEQLYRVMRTASLIGRLIKFRDHGGREYLTLAPFLASMMPVAEVKEQIERYIDSPGELREDATPIIARYRREIKTAKERLQSRLERMLTDSQYADIFQDDIITFRNDRFVVPVKVEMSGRFEGVVHDRSGSGQTLFMEPLSVIKDNNEIKNLQLEIEREKTRILRSLTGLVKGYRKAFLANLELMFVLDYYNACARFTGRLECEVPKIGDSYRMVNGYNPVLLLEKGRDETVPLNFNMSGGVKGFLVTGPNMGGKTVSLKTTGIIAAMAIAGLPVTASKETVIPHFDSIFADIGDEQSIEFSLSSFAAHVQRWDEAARGTGTGSLVLLDELGASTDPAEGVPLVRALMEHLLDSGGTIFVTTHLSQLLPFAEERPDMENCSMAFDEKELMSTYRFRQGLPERSFALPVARRLGLHDGIVKRARGLASGETMRLDKLLRNISEKLASIEEKEAKARESLEGLKAERSKLEGLIEKEKRLTTELQETRERVEKESAQKLEMELLRRKEEIQEEIRRLSKEIESRSTQDGQAEQMKKLRRLKQEVSNEAKEISKKLVMKKGRPKDIEKGERVYIKRLHKEGTTTTGTDDKGYVKVAVGAMKIRVHSSNIALLDIKPEEDKRPKKESLYEFQPVNTSMDVRGQSFTEAWPDIDRWIGDARRANQERLIVVHGKGTGVLGKKIQAALRKHKDVTKYEYAELAEGGLGATVINVKE